MRIEGDSDALSHTDKILKQQYGLSNKGRFKCPSNTLLPVNYQDTLKVYSNTVRYFACVNKTFTATAREFICENIDLQQHCQIL